MNTIMRYALLATALLVLTSSALAHRCSSSLCGPAASNKHISFLELDRLMDRMFSSPPARRENVFYTSTSFPASRGRARIEPARKRPQLQQSTQYNIETTPENYVLTLSLPGNSAETTKIEISGSTEKTLTVTSRYPRSSIAYFAPQQFAVAEDVDSASVTAEFTNGLLTLTAPRFKPTVAEPVNVPIVQRDAAAALLEEGDEVAPDEMPEAPSPGDSEDVEVRFVEDEGEE